MLQLGVCLVFLGLVSFLLSLLPNSYPHPICPLSPAVYISPSIMLNVSNVIACRKEAWGEERDGRGRQGRGGGKDGAGYIDWAGKKKSEDLSEEGKTKLQDTRQSPKMPYKAFRIIE